MYCWLCCDIIFHQYYLLPTDDNFIDKSCNIVKKEGCFEFIYKILCENCLNMYIYNYPINFKKIIKREIYGNKLNKSR